MRVNTITISGTVVGYPRSTWVPSGERCDCEIRADVGAGVFPLIFDGDLATKARRLKTDDHIAVTGSVSITNTRHRARDGHGFRVRVSEIFEEDDI